MAGMLRRLYESITLRLIRHRRAALVAGGLVTALAVLLLFRLRINPDVNSLIRRDDPTRRLTTHLLGDAPLSRSLVVVLRAERAEEIDAVMPAVAESLRASPFLKRLVATREEFVGPRRAWIEQAPLYFLPETVLERLKTRLIDSADRKAALESGARRMAEDPLAGKDKFLADPLDLLWISGEASEALSSRFPAKLRPGSSYLVFERPAVAFLKGVGKGDSFDLSFTAQIMGDLDRRLRETLGSGPVRAELAGGYVTATAQSQVMRRDIQIQFISSAVAVLLFLLWFTRSWIASHAIFVPIVLAIVWGLGYGSWILGPLTPIAMSMAAIVAGLGSDFPIYLLARFWAERAAAGRDEAILRAQLSLGRPFVGAAGTTMGGFFVLVFSQFPGMQQFGLITFLGFTFSVVAAILFFPILLTWIDARVRPPSGSMIPWVVRGAAWLVDRPARTPVAVAIVLLGAAAWGGVAAGRIPLELDLRNMLATEDPGQKVLAGLEADLGVATSPVFALLDRSVPIEDVRAKVETLRARGAIALVDGPQEFIPSPAAVARAERIRKETAGWIEGTLADLVSLGIRPEPFREGLERVQKLLKAAVPTVDALAPPLRDSFLYTDTDGRAYWVVHLWAPRSPWTPSEREKFNSAIRPVLGETTPLLSVYHLPDHQAGVIRKDLDVVGGLAAGSVVILTILAVGRLRDGILALLPVLIATGITLGVCAFMGGAVKSMNLAAIPIVLGIGVDGGIHYMAVLRARGGKRADALADMGPGYWAASVTTILGFGSIAFSSTPGLSFLGVLVIVGMTASMIATLYMLPAIAGSRER